MLNVGILSQNMACRGGFTPGALAPAAWYDPSDLSTLFQDTAGTTPVTAADQPVALMRDKSGNGLHLSQATGTKCPLYQSDGSLLFDGVDDYLNSASTIAGSAQSVAFAAKSNSAAGQLAVWNVAVSTSDRIAMSCANTATGFSARYFNGTATTGKSVAGTVSATVLTGEFDKVTPAVGLRANAVAASTSSTAGAGSTVGSFLGSSNGAALFFSGNFYGLVHLARAFAGSERANLETYLGTKAGIVL